MNRLRYISLCLCLLLSVMTMMGNVINEGLRYSDIATAGPHIFADGQLEYSAFDGGYFDASGSPCYYITDWQGNNAAVVNSAGSVIQSVAYYPYGEPTVEPKGQRYLFGGKEREHAGGRNAYDFGPRSLLPYGCWPSPDILAEKSYPSSPFSYCAGDPINFIDPDGKWNIKVSASEDRRKYPYAVFTVYDRHKSPVFRTVVKVRGQHSNRKLKYGDSPQGRYKILDWRETGNERYPQESYGKYNLLATHYEEGEGEGRDGMHVHGGGYGSGYQEIELKGTKGCIRITDEDIKALKEITDYIMNKDPEEKPSYLILKNDLETPVTFKDRQWLNEIYDFRIDLEEIEVYPKKMEHFKITDYEIHF